MKISLIFKNSKMSKRKLEDVVKDPLITKIHEHLQKTVDLWRRFQEETEKEQFPPSTKMENEYLYWQWEDRKYYVYLYLRSDSHEWVVVTEDYREEKEFPGEEVGKFVTYVGELLGDRGF